MPLVKQGRIATDVFLHVADGAELPGDGAVLVSATRFLEDPEALLKRDFRTKKSAKAEAGTSPPPRTMTSGSSRLITVARPRARRSA